MVPAVWRLCLWIFETLTDCDETYGTSCMPGIPGIQATNNFSYYGSGTADSSASAYFRNIAGLTRTVVRLCACMPSMQESVVTSLLSKCYTEEENDFNPTSTSTSTITSTSTSGAGGVRMKNSSSSSNSGNIYHNSLSELDGDSVNLPALGYSSEEWNIVTFRTTEEEDSSDEHSLTSNNIPNNHNRWELKMKKNEKENKKTFSTSLRKTQHLSLLASSVLERLVMKNPEIGSIVLSSIIDRLTPSSPSQGGLLFLPPAAVLHWYVRTCGVCIVGLGWVVLGYVMLSNIY